MLKFYINAEQHEMKKKMVTVFNWTSPKTVTGFVELSAKVMIQRNILF